MLERYPISLSLTLPAYNEEANLRNVVEAALTYLRDAVEQFEIIVVNDGSEDGTQAIIDDLVEKHQEVKGILHDPNEGYGASLRDGFAASQYDWCFFTDSDHQFRIDSLEELFPLTENADIVVGYRKDRQDAWLRCFLSWGYNQMMRLLFDVRVRDIDCAFKLIHKRVFDKVELTSRRFFVNTELLVKSRTLGLTIKEVGVDHFPREYDRSKVNLWEIPRTIREVIGIWKEVKGKPRV